MTSPIFLLRGKVSTNCKTIHNKMNLIFQVFVFGLLAFNIGGAAAESRDFTVTKNGVLLRNKYDVHDLHPLQETRQLTYVCPDADSIAPCECSAINVAPPYFQVSCLGRLVTPELVNEIFQKIRNASNMDPNAWLSVHTLEIQNTLIDHLDMAAFYHISVFYWDILDNPLLSRLLGSPDDIYLESILAQHIWFQGSTITYEGFGEALSYFNPAATNSISLASNNLGDAPEDQEIVPGIGAFTQLTQINLSGNNITRISGGQFRNHGGLSRITLIRNSIQQFEDNAFFIDDPWPELEDQYFLLDLEENQLTGAGANRVSSGVMNFTRPFTMYYDKNVFETLEARHFERILRHENIHMSMSNNPLICDPRVRWLKDEANYFENHTFNANCINDPGKTVFTSDLV